jgi:hypothetical protein
VITWKIEGDLETAERESIQSAVAEALEAAGYTGDRQPAAVRVYADVRERDRPLISQFYTASAALSWTITFVDGTEKRRSATRVNGSGMAREAAREEAIRAALDELRQRTQP